MGRAFCSLPVCRLAGNESYQTKNPAFQNYLSCSYFTQGPEGKKAISTWSKYGEIAGRLPRKLQKGYALECLFIFQHFNDWNDLMLSKNLLL